MSVQQIYNKEVDTIVGTNKKKTSVVAFTNFPQFSEPNSSDKKIENVSKDGSIQIVVGVNKFGGALQKTRMDPVHSGAGIIINEAISPNYVFNPTKSSTGLTLQPPVKENTETIRDANKGVSTVTLFADEVQLVSFLNGVNIYTSPAPLQEKRNLPTLSIGSGVSLIHGNNVDDLDAMVKGQKLLDYLNDLENEISNISHNLFALRNFSTVIFSILAGHVHITTLPGAPTAPSIETAIGVIAGQPTNIKNQIDNVIGCLNGAIRKINITQLTTKGIKSEYHKLN